MRAHLVQGISSLGAPSPRAAPSLSLPMEEQPEQDTRAGAQMQQILFQIIWLLAVGRLATGWVQL